MARLLQDIVPNPLATTGDLQVNARSARQLVAPKVVGTIRTYL